MYSIPNFILTFVRTFVSIMTVLIIIRVLLSWLRVSGKSPGGQLSRLIYEVTEPLLNLVRRFPHRFGMMDFAPIIALIALDLFEYLVTMLISAL